MKPMVCPELPTASLGSSQAPTAAVDNSAPYATRSDSTYISGSAVQTNGATSQRGGLDLVDEVDALEPAAEVLHDHLGPVAQGQDGTPLRGFAVVAPANSRAPTCVN